MGRSKKNPEACSFCTSKCMILHSAVRSPSSVVQSFFKVMIDEEYFDTLNLPPKFALSIKGLAGKSKDLEIWNGDRWPVTISMVDGSLTFRKGWNDFVSSNGIALGDFLVFHFNGSNFLVDMYDRTGCIREDLPKKKSNGNKRSRTCKDTVSDDEMDITIIPMNEQVSDRFVGGSSDVEIIQSKDNGCAVENFSEQTVKSMNDESNNKRFHSAFKAETLEEPFLEIDTNHMHKHAEDRVQILDISSYERGANLSKDDSNKKGIGRSEIPPCDANIVHLSSSDDEFIQDPTSGAKVVEDSEMEVTEKHNGVDITSAEVPIPIIDLSSQKDPKLLSASEVISRENGKCNISISDEVIKNFSTACAMSLTKHGSNKKGIGRSEIPSCDANIVDLSSSDKDEFIQNPTSRAIVVEDSEMEVTEKHNGVDIANVGVPIPIIDLSSQKEPKLLSANEVISRKNDKCNISISDEVIKNFSSACAVSHTHAGNVPVVTNEAHRVSASKGYAAVKTEVEDASRLSSPVAATLSCLILHDNQSFLELPARLPSISFSGGFKLQRKLVFLKDPYKRVWPVLYHETENLRVLRCGWEAFCKSNNIQSGDECDFGVESEPEGIYVVRIVRREK